MTHRPRWRCLVTNCPDAGQWHTDSDPEKAWRRHWTREHYEPKGDEK